MPKLSPTMEEGQISRWLKAEGDAIEANETIAEVDTDKATMEMTSLEGEFCSKFSFRRAIMQNSIKPSASSVKPARIFPRF